MPNKQNVRRVVQQARSLIIAGNSLKTLPTKLMQLITHPRNRRVHFKRRITHKDADTKKMVGFKSFVVDKNLTYDGITKPMKQAFWTSFAAPPVRTKVDPCTKAATTKAANGCYGGGKGKNHGTRVHQDFERLVKVIRGELRKKNGDMVVGEVDPCAYRILTSLINRKIVPFYSEFVIFDEFSGLATAIDYLAWDTVNNTLIAVEIKTGHIGQSDYAAVCGNAHFREPHDVIPDSPLNRAATQLLMSMLIISRRYGVQIDHAIVVRPLSTSNKVQLYDMPEWTKDHARQERMYAHLRAFVTSGANARRITKRTGMGEKQRAALERQESRRTLLETGEDPAANVFWTPNPVPVQTHIAVPVPCASHVDMDNMQTIGEGKGKAKMQEPPVKSSTRILTTPTQRPRTDCTKKGESSSGQWCNTMNSSPCQVITTSDLSWRNQVMRA